MDEKEVKEMLEKQLKMLSEQSEYAKRHGDTKGLVGISSCMREIAFLLLTL